MADPSFGLPERQVVGPAREAQGGKSHLESYADALRSARWWIERVGEAMEAGDTSEVVRLMNFREAVLEKLNRATGENDGQESA